MLNLSPATVLRQIRAGIIPPSNNAKAPLESSNDGISKIRI
ncbi:helix-turn-helix domain-containing protein [Mesorhizobium sp. LNHC221B00]|nr:helix-turn-helix domain-containing protein [Mesorhizobium sp. LNHC221B00]